MSTEISEKDMNSNNNIKAWNIKGLYILSTAAIACLIIIIFIPLTVSAKTKTLTYTPLGKDTVNYAIHNSRNIREFIKGNNKKKLIIKPGTTLYLARPMEPGNNTTIIAKNVKVIVANKKSSAISNVPKSTGYYSIKNLTIIGGKWYTIASKGYTGSLIAINHGSNIVFRDMTIKVNYKGHGLEIISCKNVKVINCKLTAIGTCPASCHESVIEVEPATEESSPKVAEYGSKYVNGLPCKNIVIKNCKVSGAYPVHITQGVGYGTGYSNYRYNNNVTVEGCTLKGKTSTCIGIFNTTGKVIIRNNNVKTKTVTNDGSTDAIHVDTVGTSPAKMYSSTVLITGNTAYGGRYGAQVITHGTIKYKSITLTNNNLYSGLGADSAYQYSSLLHSCETLIIENNITGGW